MDALTTFKTTNARRYLGTLCKHFGHKIPVQHDGDTGRIEFPFGQCDLKADDSVLELTISAESQAGLDKIAQVMSSHLERFAFRENPELTWHPHTQSDVPA